MSKLDAAAGGAPAATPDSGGRRGRLRIFFGYAAGVGKTQAMLTAALLRQAVGDDVIAGLVEARTGDTAALLARLEQMARRMVLVDNRPVTALDTDALLARSPRLVLVDDLARLNPRGSRHAHRYQDVAELLNAGIDVYATLNVQHLESLHDVVAQITGHSVTETVPDNVLDQADELTLVDMPVDELLDRLPPPAQPLSDEELSRQRFFRPGNLMALREMALRRAADRVDEGMRTYMRSHAIAGPWPARERILVCVSPSPLSERLVRTTRRLAQRLNAEWIAAYVETDGGAGAAGSERVTGTLRLAERLGGQTVWLSGQSVAETLVAYARQHNVTKIVAGKPLRPRWQELLRGGSIIDQIVRQSRDLDVYVISAPPDAAAGASAPLPDRRAPLPWPQIGLAAGLVTLATLLGLPLRGAITPTNLLVLYVLVVIVTAVWYGRAAAVTASLLSVIAFDFIFVPPYYTMDVTDAEYLLTFVGLLAVGMVVGTLTARARAQEFAARRREAQTAALYELSRRLAQARSREDIARSVADHAQQTLGYPTALFLPAEGGRPERPAARTHDFDQVPEAAAVAGWVLNHGQPAGCLTETMRDSPAYWMPLQTSGRVVGVLAVRCGGDPALLTGDRRRLLFSMASQAALALERAHLAEQARRTQLLEETDRLKTALLNALSHDLRTPLASITGVLSTLHDDMALLDDAARHELVATAWGEARRLNRLVGNLLDMTRLESGALKVVREPADVEDLVGAALAQLPGRLQGREVRLEIPAGLPLVSIDFTLMVQVLVNLLDNAVKYSPPATPITVSARRERQELIISVADRGPGLPPGDSRQLFTHFFRVDRDGVGGTGLGLAIALGIIEAHGGRIWAADRPGGGAVFALALPLPDEAISRRPPADIPHPAP